MKRIAAVVSALVLLACVLTGCNALISPEGQLSAYTLQKNAFEKTGGLDGAEMKIRMDLHVEAEESTIDLPILYALKVRGFNREKPVGWAKVSTKFLAQKTEAEFWFDGDYIYTDLEDRMKLKIPCDSDEAAEYMWTDFRELLKELPEEPLKGAAVVRNEDGSKTFSADLSREEFDELFSEFSDETEQMAVDEFLSENDISEELHNCRVEITVLENGYLGSYVLSFDLTVKTDGEIRSLDVPGEMHYRIKASLEFVDPGKEVTVTLPEDLDDYLEYEEYYEKYPYGPDWEYNEETGKYTYVGEDGFWLYDEEKDEWYTEYDGERLYFEDTLINWDDWEYSEETGKYTYVGEDDKWIYDEEKDDWYTERDGERSYFNGEPFDVFGPDWEYNEETGKYSYVGEDEIWLYDEEKDDWYYSLDNDGDRYYFNENVAGRLGEDLDETL